MGRRARIGRELSRNARAVPGQAECDRELGHGLQRRRQAERVKRLHVQMAYALAEGPGVVRLGDEAVALACGAGLRGTALPADWPTPKELAIPDHRAMDEQ